MIVCDLFMNSVTKIMAITQYMSIKFKFLHEKCIKFIFFTVNMF